MPITLIIGKLGVVAKVIGLKEAKDTAVKFISEKILNNADKKLNDKEKEIIDVKLIQCFCIGFVSALMISKIFSKRRNKV